LLCSLSFLACPICGHFKVCEAFKGLFNRELAGSLTGCSTAESVKTVSPYDGLPQFWLILFIFIKMGTITVTAESPASSVPIPAPSAATTYQKIPSCTPLVINNPLEPKSSRGRLHLLCYV